MNPVFSVLTQTTNLYVDPAGDRYRIGMPLNANIAADTVGRFATGAKADHLALIHENSDLTVEKYTFAQLDELASRFAVFLIDLGVKQGQAGGHPHRAEPANRNSPHGHLQNRCGRAHPVPSLRSGRRCAHHERLRCGSHHHQLGVLGCAAGASERTFNPQTPNCGRSHRARRDKF